MAFSKPLVKICVPLASELGLLDCPASVTVRHRLRGLDVVVFYWEELDLGAQKETLEGIPGWGMWFVLVGQNPLCDWRETSQT